MYIESETGANARVLGTGALPLHVYKSTIPRTEGYTIADIPFYAGMNGIVASASVCVRLSQVGFPPQNVGNCGLCTQEAELSKWYTNRPTQTQVDSLITAETAPLKQQNKTKSSSEKNVYRHGHLSVVDRGTQSLYTPSNADIPFYWSDYGLEVSTSEGNKNEDQEPTLERVPFPCRECISVPTTTPTGDAFRDQSPKGGLRPLKFSRTARKPNNSETRLKSANIRIRHTNSSIPRTKRKLKDPRAPRARECKVALSVPFQPETMKSRLHSSTHPRPLCTFTKDSRMATKTNKRRRLNTQLAFCAPCRRQTPMAIPYRCFCFQGDKQIAADNDHKAYSRRYGPCCICNLGTNSCNSLADAGPLIIERCTACAEARQCYMKPCGHSCSLCRCLKPFQQLQGDLTCCCRNSRSVEGSCSLNCKTRLPISDHPSHTITSCSNSADPAPTPPVHPRHSENDSGKTHRVSMFATATWDLMNLICMRFVLQRALQTMGGQMTHMAKQAVQETMADLVTRGEGNKSEIHSMVNTIDDSGLTSIQTTSNVHKTDKNGQDHVHVSQESCLQKSTTSKTVVEDTAPHGDFTVKNIKAKFDPGSRQTFRIKEEAHSGSETSQIESTRPSQETNIDLEINSPVHPHGELKSCKNTHSARKSVSFNTTADDDSEFISGLAIDQDTKSNDNNPEGDLYSLVMDSEETRAFSSQSDIVHTSRATANDNYIAKPLSRTGEQTHGSKSIQGPRSGHCDQSGLGKDVDSRSLLPGVALS